MKKIKLLQKLSLGILFCFVAISFSYVALAANEGDILNTESLKSSGNFYALAFIGAKFVSWGGQLVNWALNLNSQLMYSHTIKIGWPIARDIANLGFVLAIILIAFVTILRIENYATKQMLGKLIAAALLVNFSLVIAGVFIDFSSVITDFFVRKISDPNQLATAIANALKVQGILGAPPSLSASNILTGFLSGGWTRGLLEFMANLAFVVFFTGLAAISMLGLAAMLYIRYLILTFLLTLMPIAWLLWIWPDTAGNWKKWWSEFFRWVWFAPAMSFFIYLAVAIIEVSAADKSLNIGASFGVETFAFANAGQTIGQMLTVIGILIMGMMAANEMGIAGAGMTISAAKGFKNMVFGGAAGAAGLGMRGLYRGADTLIGRTTGKTIRERVRNTAAGLSNSKIPFVGAGMRALSQQLEVGGEKQMAERQKYYGSLPEEALLKSLTDPYLAHPEERAAIINAIAEKNKLEKAKDFLKRQGKTEEEITVLMDNFERSSVQRGGEGAKMLISKDPTAAGLDVAGASRLDLDAYLANPEIKAKVERAFDFLKPEAMETIDPKLFAGRPELLSKVRPNLLSRLLERNYDIQEEFVKNLAGEIKRVEGVLESERNEQDRKIMYVASSINQNPAWVLKIPSPILRRPRGGFGGGAARTPFRTRGEFTPEEIAARQKDIESKT